MARKSRRASAAVATAVATAVVVYVLTDNTTLDNVCYLGVLVGASIGAWIGAERAPRGRRLVPRLIATGVSLSALGDVLWTALDAWGASTDVSIADPPWFASYVVLCLALWIALRRSLGPSSQRIDRDFALDVLTIVVVSVLIFWSLSVSTIVADHSVGPFVRLVWASYPIADAVLLALVARALFSRSARAAVGPSFAAGVCLWLAADIAYLRTPEEGVAGVAMDVAWMIAPVLIAKAAWHSAPAYDAEKAPPRSTALAQLLVAVAPLFVPAGLEVARDLFDQPDHPGQLLIGTTALIAIAFVRTARLIRSEERALRQLEAARDAALDASRVKSMFLANMSHEIRTPLTTVLATAELLEDTPLDEEQSYLLEKMTRSGGLLTSLVEGILDFSRIEAGQLKLASAAFDLHAMVADAADAYSPRAIRQGLSFDSRIDPDVPQVMVGDRGRLYQVLTNLLDNAVKFTSAGQVSLTVRTTSDDSGQAVEFIVSDTGIGIPEEHQGMVFESFHQVDGSMTRSYGGNGLGLAICRELTELIGGSISLQSQFGAGSTFVARIPLVGVPVAEDTPLLRTV
jgi:signal transduction histidine kinase